MKRATSILLTFCLLLALVPTALAATNAVLSPQGLTVDGQSVNCEKYNIDGSNYFKLRDIAYLLNGTGSQFSVGWDAASSTVSITTGQAYTSNGSELVVGEDKASTTTPSSQTIRIDGVVRSDLTVYNIGGNNFFKLRDLGDALGFEVDYNAATNTAVVNSVGRAGETTVQDPLQRTSLSVNRSTGELSITRPAPTISGNMGDSGVWTIFVYMCGSDLESRNGSATGDLIEMLNGAVGANVRFVVETGGSSDWWIASNDEEFIFADRCQRFLIQNQEIHEVYNAPRVNMGRSDSLADFLSWGVGNFASEHMAVILWDHGGGSIVGACLDENYNGDCLDLQEMDDALFEAFCTTGRTFDLIGFDACLMSTIETANVMASYADYFCSSEETEPGSGWDYTAIGSYLSVHSNADGRELGRAICDGYKASMITAKDAAYTMSVIDLSKIDPLLTQFNRFAKNLLFSSDEMLELWNVAHAIYTVDRMGSNNRVEGYCNMVDMGSLVTACSPYVDGASAVLWVLSDAVDYQVHGSSHYDASGLAIYYPLHFNGIEELTVLGQIAISPYYLSYVDRQNQARVNGGNIAVYDDSYWYGRDGIWRWSSNAEAADRNYWESYVGYGDNQLIWMRETPFFNEDAFGIQFSLTEESLLYAWSVYGYVVELDYDQGVGFYLGHTLDTYNDWETGTFLDDFSGMWLSLPDGQDLAVYIQQITDDYVDYVSPISLNGEQAFLHLRQFFDDMSVDVYGAWGSPGANGVPSRDQVRLKAGDVIVPLYETVILSTGEAAEGFDGYGVEYVVDGPFYVTYAPMDVSEYAFGFCIDDIFGETVYTPFAQLGVDEDGGIFYYYTD